LQSDRLAGLRAAASQAERLPPATVLQGLGIQVHTRDARQTGLPAGTIDLFVSTGVLEYIPVEALEAILAELKRLGRDDAVQSHYLNLVDQYSYFDRNITAFNFLKYPAERWKYLNSPLTWQNRLRISDYRRLFGRAGLQITKELNTSGQVEDLK